MCTCCLHKDGRVLICVTSTSGLVVNHTKLKSKQKASNTCDLSSGAKASIARVLATFCSSETFHEMTKYAKFASIKYLIFPS